MKKCIICENKAIFAIKDSSDYYCEMCAMDNFSDTAVLLQIEDDSKKIDEMLNDTINE